MEDAKEKEMHCEQRYDPSSGKIGQLYVVNRGSCVLYHIIGSFKIMNEKPRGRGRGRGISSEFSNLGIYKTKSEESASTINDVIHMLDILLLGGGNDGDDNQIENIFRISQTAVKTKEDVHEIAAAISNACLTNEAFINVGCKLCAALSPIEAEQVKFRSVIFNLLQKEFDDRNKTRENNRARFFNSIKFICQFYVVVRAPNNTPYKVLTIAIINYLKMLLQSNELEANVLFSDLFQRHCSELEETDAESLNDLIQIVRAKILEPSTSKLQRGNFLRLFEMYLVNWTPLPDDVVDFYAHCSCVD